MVRYSVATSSGALPTMITYSRSPSTIYTGYARSPLFERQTWRLVRERTKCSCDCLWPWQGNAAAASCAAHGLTAECPAALHHGSCAMALAGSSPHGGVHPAGGFVPSHRVGDLPPLLLSYWVLTPRAYASSGGQLHARIRRDVCPQCQSPKDQNNGHLHHGQPHDQGHDWGRQCVDGFAHDRGADDPRTRSARVRGERISWRGSGRAVGVTRQWRGGGLGPCVAAVPDQRPVAPLTCAQAVMIPRRAVAAGFTAGT
jgi:hypothetical protein